MSATAFAAPHRRGLYFECRTYVLRKQSITDSFVMRFTRSCTFFAFEVHSTPIDNDRRNDRNPAAVLTVVRIIGTPTCDSASRTLSTGSGFSASSWKWVTKWSPSAEPITITKIGTITTTTSMAVPDALSAPNVQIVPTSAGKSESSVSLRLPTLR